MQSLCCLDTSIFNRLLSLAAAIILVQMHLITINMNFCGLIVCYVLLVVTLLHLSHVLQILVSCKYPL